MDEALRKTGDYPNIALTPGKRVHAATGEAVDVPTAKQEVGWQAMECRVTAKNGLSIVEFVGFATPEVLTAVLDMMREVVE